MTPASLISDLTARGVEFQASGDKLQFRPVDRLKPGEIEAIRKHKLVILKLIRSENWQAAPIIPGTVHFSIWVSDPDGPLPEFIPGYHYDIRQPSRLRSLCSRRNEDQQP